MGESGCRKNVNRGKGGEDEPEDDEGQNMSKQIQCGADEVVI